MTIKEQLAEKKAALVELEPQLKSDPTDEMIEQGETLVKEIADLEAKCAQAERAETLLKSIETVDETNNDNSEEKKMSQIEEFTQKAAEITDKKAGVMNVLQKIELFEVSIVTVPANQNAVVTEVKGVEPETKAGRRNSRKDADVINQIIDLAKSLLDEPEDKPTEDEEKSEEAQPEVNPAGEEPKSEGNSKRAEALLEKINSIKGGS